MASSRVYQKITSPIHRSTAYDFNVHLDHQSLHKAGHRITNAAEGDPNEMGVCEHEIVVRTRDAQTQYTSGRLRVFSALNNLLLNNHILEELERDNATFWRGQTDGADAITPLQTLKHLQAGKYPVREGADDILKEAKDRIYTIASRSLNNVLHRKLEYVGVAITPQKLFPRNSRQDPQGFACTRGGLNTIHNTGDAIIQPGDQIEINFAMQNPSGHQLLSNPSHYSTGTPHGKMLVQVAPRRPDGDDNAFVNRVLNQMRHLREPLARSGEHNDALVEFDLAGHLAAGNPRPNALLLHRFGVEANISTEVGGDYLNRCALDIVNLTLGLPNANIRYAGGEVPMFVRVLDLADATVARDNLQRGTAWAGGTRVFYFVEDEISVPVAAAAGGVRVVAPARNFRNLWYSDGGVGAANGLTDPLPCQEAQVIAGAPAGLYGIAGLAAGNISTQQEVPANLPTYNVADGTDTLLLGGDSLTYLLELMCDGEHGARNRQAPGNQNNPFLSRHSPMVELVRNVVKHTLIAQKFAERRSIGMALSGAHPGEPFDIVLSDS